MSLYFYQISTIPLNLKKHFAAQLKNEVSYHLFFAYIFSPLTKACTISKIQMFRVNCVIIYLSLNFFFFFKSMLNWWLNI